MYRLSSTLPPSPPADKANAREDQAGQSSAAMGPGTAPRVSHQVVRQSPQTAPPALHADVNDPEGPLARPTGG